MRDHGEGAESSEESIQTKTTNSTSQYLTQSDTSTCWESSVSEFEDSKDEEVEEEHERRFRSMRAQHYFMKQALMRGKELIETDEE